MQAMVRVFTLTPAAPGATAAPPQPAPEFVVEAKSHDGLRQAARAQLVHRESAPPCIRAVSRFDAERSNRGGHADRFWAVVMAASGSACRRASAAR